MSNSPRRGKGVGYVVPLPDNSQELLATIFDDKRAFWPPEGLDGSHHFDPTHDRNYRANSSEDPDCP